MSWFIRENDSDDREEYERKQMRQYMKHNRRGYRTDGRTPQDDEDGWRQYRKGYKRGWEDRDSDEYEEETDRMSRR